MPAGNENKHKRNFPASFISSSLQVTFKRFASLASVFEPPFRTICVCRLKQDYECLKNAEANYGSVKVK